MKRVLVVGEVNPDLILSGCESPPELGKEILGSDFTLTVGGAAALCAMGLARLGTPVAFLAKIGPDPWGELCLDALRQRGVDVSLIRPDPRLKTGVTVVISLPRDRAFVTYPGSIGALADRDLAAVDLAPFDHVHVSSFFLQPELRPTCRGFFARARAAGLTTSLDPGCDPHATWDDGLQAALGETDIFFPNEVELAAIGASDDPETALRALAAGGPGRVVAKLGAQGCITLAEGTGGALVHVAAYPVTPVDTTGAGDSFNAGFLHAWLTGRPLRDALRFAAACGALSTLGVGGSGRQATVTEAEALLVAHP
jgi:sugar/nucleoside kinase (ribokinase family)